MILSSKLIKSGKTLDTEFKKLSKADGEYVDIGWFKSQGKHSGTSMTHAELAHYHATGGGGRVTPRDILALTSAVYPAGKDKKVTAAISKWLRTGNLRDLESLLDDLGKVQVDRIKSLFGDTRLGATSDNPDPLIDTRELKNKTARKTSTSGVVKEGIL